MRTELARPALPAEARRRCDDPGTPPGRDLTQEETARFWDQDRRALRTCERRRATAVTAAEFTTEGEIR